MLRNTYIAYLVCNIFNILINNNNNYYYYYNYNYNNNCCCCSSKVPIWLITYCQIVRFRYFYYVNLNSKRIYAVVWSLTFHMNFRTFWINLIAFCTFFLLFSYKCAVYVYLCTFAFECSFSNWPCPALLSLHVNKLNLIKLYYQDIQKKKMCSLPTFFLIITYLMLLYMWFFVCFLCVYFVFFFVFSYIPVLSLHWPYGSCVSALLTNNWIIVIIIIIIIINLPFC